MAWYLIWAADGFADEPFKVRIEEYDSDKAACEDAMDLSYEVMEDFHHIDLDDIANDIVDNTIEDHPILRGEAEQIYEDAYEQICKENVNFRVFRIIDPMILLILDYRPRISVMELEGSAYYDFDGFVSRYCEEITF